MSNGLQRFAFDHKPIRIVTEGAELWFVAKRCRCCLGIF